MAGAFDRLAFDFEFDTEEGGGGPLPPGVTLWQLALANGSPFDHTVDDHERPPHPLWRRYRYPDSQVALLLFRDGTVIETDVILGPEVIQADDTVAGGHQVILRSDSWQYAVLHANNYPLIPYP